MLSHIFVTELLLRHMSDTFYKCKKKKNNGQWLLQRTELLAVFLPVRQEVKEKKNDPLPNGCIKASTIHPPHVLVV